NYYEELVGRLSPHGLMLIDNTMWSGRVLDEADATADTEAVRAFNDHVAADERTINLTVPLGDGVTMVALAG
ncbi:MAG: SAM-dependent methyltransferase, partial [Acidimicrobiia bacterium]|nr:SAM-dependent methyltransferase [Acidimicrobiia bacterium]